MNQTNLFSTRSIFLLLTLYSISFLVIYLALTTEYSPNDDLAGVRLTIFALLAPIIFKYFVQLLSLPFYSPLEKIRRRKAIRQGMMNFSPKVSVLIPAWNEEVGILKTIQSVVNTAYKNLEIIVVNDGSTDSTHRLVTGYIAEFKKNSQSATEIKYLQLTNGGKARALNQGVRLASGEIIVTVDADSVMDEAAIEKLVPYFNDPKVGAVAGNVIVGNRSRPIEWLQQIEYLYGFFFKRADSVFNSVYIIGGAAAAYRKEVLEDVGGFDHEIITEDIEMSTRILSEGYKTRYATDVVVFTEGPADWKGLCNQRLRWKFGRLLTFMKHKSLFFSTNKKHNSYLTFLLLPMAVYAELTLMFEALLLAIFYGYTILTNDYVPLAFVIVFMTTLVVIQILCDSKRRFHQNLLLLAPIAWMLFYIIDLVEWQALCRSLKRLITRQELQWQKWVRVGLAQHTSQNEALTEAD
ncbi:glycosyltransferase family 2 protein [Aliikangiella sp. G2MR2-5]|uniref:glycosyltransferase n=1 Tax=Aliikangiella sp. G2MR2-5 TaxID=2788943 RepID=UPI0018AB5E32|nr:glycosyltransferase [Aliikangiella sp. G2MR2-5]